MGKNKSIGIVFGLFAFAVGCGEGHAATELIIVVGSDLVVPQELDRIELRIVQPNGVRLMEEVELTGEPGDMPRSFFLENNGEALDPVEIRADGFLGDERVVRQEVSTGYLPGETRSIRIDLLRSCIGMRCGDDATCIAGSCQDPFVDPETLPFWDGKLAPTPCEAGYADCDPAPGCEARLDSPNHCGACFAGCGDETPLCAGLDGQCVSICAPLADCDGTCIDLDNDEEHCGSCATRCDDPNGEAVCSAGTCAIECNVGFHSCDGVCVPDDQMATCGSRCSPCATGENGVAECVDDGAGNHECSFVCDPSFADCDGATGCEAPTYADPENCGGCGISCGLTSAGVRYGCSDSICDDVVVEVAAGARHTCALLHGGELWCWGANDYGQLGFDSAGVPQGPTQVALDGNAIAVTLGAAHTCALLRNRSLFCWGAGASGQLGTLDAPVMRAEPLRVQAPLGGDGRFDTIAAGRAHTCATDRTGGSFCWGDNARGQLGVPGLSETSRPTRVLAGDALDADSIMAGGDSTCMLRSLGDLYCFGDNQTGQLGTANDVPPMTDSGRSVSDRFTMAALGAGHVCGGSLGESMSCWGDDRRKQVGITGIRGTTPIRSVRIVRSTSGTQTFSTGDNHTCHVAGTDGAVLCWGANDQAQIDGSGVDTEVRTATQSARGGSLLGVTHLAAGGAHTCALVPPSTVVCWGDNDYEQLGRGSGGDDAVATDVAGIGADR